MDTCENHILEAHYPQIWSWGIVWKCSNCNNFFICNCFKSSIDNLIERSNEDLKKGNLIESVFSKFAHNFPPSFVNFLVGEEISYFDYHGDQPLFTFYENAFKSGVRRFIAFLKNPKLNYLPNICHLCLKKHSDHYFCDDIYGSAFKQRYGAYVSKQLYGWGLFDIFRDATLIPPSIKERYFKNILIPRLGHSTDFDKAYYRLERDLENEIRAKLDYPLIGETWIQETMLFKVIKEIMPKYEVIHHYFPDWLGGQELDIFIKELSLGIEYQGKQHFEPIEFFGGEDGFRQLIERDKRKKTLCEENSITLIYFFIMKI